MAQLELTGIEKSFGTMRALSGVDLDVAQGEFVCLLGESGCGKTTLLRIVAGLETATSGTLSINDEDVSGVPSHQRNIGLVHAPKMSSKKAVIDFTREKAERQANHT